MIYGLVIQMRLVMGFVLIVPGSVELVKRTCSRSAFPAKGITSTPSGRPVTPELHPLPDKCIRRLD